MISLFAWSSPVPPWLMAILLLALFAAALTIAAGLDPGASTEIGSWRWSAGLRLG